MVEISTVPARSSRSWSSGRRALYGVGVATLVALVLMAPGCGEEEQGSAPQRPLRTTATALAGSTSSCSGSDPTCTGTGAHARHAGLAIACDACHACGGLYQFSTTYQLPSGKSIAGGTMTKGSTTTSCSVLCHNPSGSSGIAPITWNTQGPLACSSCHPQGVTAGAVSSHPGDNSSVAANRAACQQCHDLSAHMSGKPRIIMGNGSVVVVDASNLGGADPSCLGCHTAGGKTIAGKTPPLLEGYSDPAGDFHGSRAGSGFGGTLVPPFQRGQVALPCLTCHDAHSSPNPFLIAPIVQGNGIPAGAMDRQGIGGQNLCRSCHIGNNHAGCLASNCHSTDPAPAGKPCLYCHGHEGVRFMTVPTYDPSMLTGDCSHCHGAGPWYWASISSAQPQIDGSSIVVANLGSTTATLTWNTPSVYTTSYVEYGTTTPANVAGDDGFAISHSVTLTGLTPATNYVFRVRSANALRAVAESGTFSFTTTVEGAPAQPTLVHVNNIEVPDPNITQASATFNWNAAQLPAGHTPSYRLQISTMPTFATTVVDTWLGTNSYTRVFTISPSYVIYYWRVLVKDTTTGVPSAWSRIDSFWAVSYDPNY
jgi:predicted CXXCH cytochrome family protein